MHDFILVKDKCPKKIGLVTFWYFPDRSVKYTMTPHRNKGTTYATDLKFSPFSPEVDISDTRRFAKFQVSRSRGSDFTDQSVFYPNYSLSGQQVVGST